MTINIPIWILWILGIGAGLVVTSFAIIGAIFVWNWKDGIHW